MNSFYRVLLCGTSALTALGSMTIPSLAQAIPVVQPLSVSAARLASRPRAIILAQATTTAPDPKKPAAEPTQEIVVTGQRGSLRDSLIMKRSSELVTDNISTKEIGQLPDVTIAEELNHLPAVNTTRDRGNASQASVRGLGPRLVFGLVNGREVASSEPSQNVRWEVYPSEILGGVQVYKSQSSELIPGGIAATIDIRTLDPLDYSGPALSVRGGPSYNSNGEDLPHYNGVGYRASAGYISHLTDNLAIALTAAIQREKNGYSQARTFNWNTPVLACFGGCTQQPTDHGDTGDLNGDGLADSTTWGEVTDVREINQDRSAFAGTIGWRANDNLKITADGLFSAYHIAENNQQAWYGNNDSFANWQNSGFDLYNGTGAYAGSGNHYTIVNGAVVAATLDTAPAGPFAAANYESEIARYNERHYLAAGGIHAKWTSGPWEANFDVSHSEAWRNNRWESINLSDVFASGLQYDLTPGRPPSGSLTGTIYTQDQGFVRTPTGALSVADPSIQSVGGPRNSANSSAGSGTGVSDGPERTRDQISAIAADLSRTFDSSFFSAIEFGARYSDREKKHRHYAFALCAGSGSTVFTTPLDQNSQVCSSPQIQIAIGPGQGVEEFVVPDFNVPNMVYAPFGLLRSFVYPNDEVPLGSEIPTQRTTVEERGAEGFVKLSFASDTTTVPMTGSVGVHVTNVRLTSSGLQQDTSVPGPPTFTPVSITRNSTDVLPSLNLNFHLTDDQLLRFGAAIAISRPPLEALVTGFTLFPNAVPVPTANGGNPLLKPYKADQLDLSYEWYFHDESLFAASFFYKHLENIIGASSSNVPINGTTYLVGSENNVKGGDIEGIELTFQSRFYFLPDFLSDFGVYTNYAYVHTDIHEVAPFNSVATGTPTGPYPIVGLAEHTAEFDLYYNRGGFEARVAVKHHSPITVAPTWVGTDLEGLADETTLDVSASYQLNEHLGVRLQARNLTNEREIFSKANNSTLIGNNVGYALYGESYLFDLSLKY